MLIGKMERIYEVMNETEKMVNFIVRKPDYVRKRIY